MLVIVAANNHYAGFGPRIGNTFRKMLGLSEVRCNDDAKVSKKKEALYSNTKQTTLSDFLK
jgi:hypothetical protein